VLDGLDTIRLCVGYTSGGRKLNHPPLGAEALAECQPVYEDMPGWNESTVGVRREADLPKPARNYLARIAEITGTPIDIISTGPDRADTIILRHPLD
jgi:adenylosuccinate synthase